MKKNLFILLTLLLTITFIIPAQAEYLAVNLLDTLCAPSCAIETDSGALVVTDVFNKRVWTVEDSQTTLLAGAESVLDRYEEPMGGYSDTTPAESLFAEPWAIAPFLDGYAVSDTGNNVLRLITRNRVQTLNGHTSNPLIRIAQTGVIYDRPTGLTADEEGNLYVSNTESGRIYRLSPNGEVIIYFDQLTEPMGLCWQDGTLYVAETGAHRIVRIIDDELQVVAGSGQEGFVDGPAAEARFSWPNGVTVDADGTVYVADTANSAIRRVRNGEVETVLQRTDRSTDTFPFSPRSLLLTREGELLVCDPYARMLCSVPTDD